MTILHLIDSNGALRDGNQITEFLQNSIDGKEDLHRIGCMYHVVCVFGGQSSGKSTLLNELFGIGFQTLDSDVRRGQTTQGAFMGATKLASKQPLLVIDLEGTDGLERGEDQNFERQISLFGLCVADTLIVNLWAVDVGRVNAANLSLLRTIFEVNMHLFLHSGYKKEEKPTLLVVLRDFIDKNPEPILTAVRTSFDSVWKGIKKPPAFAESSFDDFFVLKCFTLPHFHFQRELFDEEVQRLRSWFLTDSCESFVFHKEGMFRHIPLESLPSYVSNCWETIQSSKELDIPSQREMMARCRCQEVTGNLMKIIVTKREELCEKINEGEVIPRLSLVLRSLEEECLKTFHDQTRLYSETVVSHYKEELHQQWLSHSKDIIQSFTQRASRDIAGRLECEIHTIMDRHLRKTVSHAATLPSHSNSPVETLLIDNAAWRAAQLCFWKAVAADMNGLVSKVLTAGHSDSLQQYYEAFREDDIVKRGLKRSLIQEAVHRVRNRLNSMAANAADSLHRVFEHELNHRPDGQVRPIHSCEALVHVAPQAKLSALMVLGLLLYFRIDCRPDSVAAKSSSLEEAFGAFSAVVRSNEEEEKYFLKFHSISEVPLYPTECRVVSGDANQGVKQECVLMSSQAVVQAFDQFSTKVDFTLTLKMASIKASQSNIPAWVFIAMFALGFNELMYVLHSPLLLLILVVVVYVYGRNAILEQWRQLQERGPAWITLPLQFITDKLNSVLQGGTEEDAVPRKKND